MLKLTLLQIDGFGFAGPIGLVIAILFIFILLITLIKRYKRCPSDRILVVYGKTGGDTSAKCVHGGAAFIWPIIQDYSFLYLTPISIEVNLINALSKQNIRVNVPSRFTIGISTEPSVMQNAAERLLGLNQDMIQELAQEIIFGQLRLVVASMDIEEINVDRDKFLANVTANVEGELSKIGLQLINVNVTDIQDESGYINALGQEAAAKAINDAKMSVAEKNRDGSIGQANAQKDQRIKVSDADALALVGEAEAKAKSTEGENTALIQIAKSNAERQVKEWRAASSPENDVPQSLSVWATASGLTVEMAAQNIESTALQWQAALLGIRSLRLLGKAAVDAEQVDFTTTANNYINQLNAVGT